MINKTIEKMMIFCEENPQLQSFAECIEHHTFKVLQEELVKNFKEFKISGK